MPYDSFNEVRGKKKTCHFSALSSLAGSVGGRLCRRPGPRRHFINERPYKRDRALECHVREILARWPSIGTWMGMNDDSGDNFCGMEDLNESSRDKSASDVDWNSFYYFKVLKAIPIINENSSWWRRYIHAPTISTNLNIYTQSSLWTMWKVKSILHSTSFVKQRASSAHLFLSSALVMPSSKKR